MPCGLTEGLPTFLVILRNEYFVLMARGTVISSVYSSWLVANSWIDLMHFYQYKAPTGEPTPMVSNAGQKNLSMPTKI